MQITSISQMKVKVHSVLTVVIRWSFIMIVVLLLLLSPGGSRGIEEGTFVLSRLDYWTTVTVHLLEAPNT